MFVVSVLAFLLIRLAPGDPAALIAGDFATTSDIDNLRVAMGLDQPVWMQFAIWLRGVLTGDLGTSIFSQVPVTRLFAQRLEPTLSIALATIALALALAIPLGMLAAHHQGSWVDHAVLAFTTLALSTPVFLVGYLLVHGFAVELGWFPVQGYVYLAEGGIVAWARSLVLPCTNLAVVYAALITRMTRATVLEVLKEDYIRTSRALGFGVLAVSRHALSNAALPIATTVGTSLALLLGGVVVTETVFAIPGIGRLMIEAVQRHDYPVIQGVLLLSAGAYVLVNLLIDMSYGWFDPRIRRQG